MSSVSYASGPADKALLGTPIPKLFDQIVAQHGDREAVVSIHQDVRLTYAQLADRVNKLAKAFISAGFEKGDRVGIWSPNNVEWLTTQYATAKAGIILVTINPAYRVHELAYVLEQSGCRGLVMQNQFKTSDYEGMITELCPELAEDFAGALNNEKFPNLKAVISMTSSDLAGIYDWTDFLGLASNKSDEELNVRQSNQDMDDAINIQYTSGTTGFPKGATLSHHNILNNGYFVASAMNFTEEDRLVVPVPLYHCFGMVMGNLGCLSHGACAIYPSEGFEPEAVLQAVQAEKATALYGVPTMFIAELALPNFSDYELSTLRTGIMAGAPCPIETMKQVNESMHMTEVEIAYGMTETSPVSFQTRVDSPLDKRVSTVGRVHPHVEVKIIDPETGSICPVGEMGELCTRGYSVMLGYWENPEATATAIDPNGWMHTGDTAIMDGDGYVNIVGRIKDMIVRGGENVYPREIEEYLMTHDSIEAVQVTGVPDPKYGEEIIAWVSLVGGAEMSENDVKEYCKGKIAHYKVPRYIRFSADFPMTVTGKVQKFKMREISIKELGLEELTTA
ncbi:MAG: AMP-binding protein [Pseudomonadota bacterium]|nr:AMP-binding protein [Pseudomonadales bacterium]MEE3290505.1 AMP-binding protein [Pseudomonadota bacterium]GIT22046.1 MAG: AMP-binding protein [Gammaproteobacteria bacterium]|tara:strand:- start:2384 stop:4075 length:1692 start_codon:yes stop_codon:yes gene_type:complete